MIDESNPYRPPIEIEVQPRDRKVKIIKRVWSVLFLIGCVTLVAAVIGIRFNDGTQPIDIVVFTAPLFVGMPTSLLSIIFAFLSRLSQKRTYFSMVVLLTHIVVFVVNFRIAVIACC